MDEQRNGEYVDNIPNIDMDAFDRQQREFLFELQRKRILLDECRQELNDAILKQQELERELLSEKRKNSNDDLQNIILRNAVEKLEEERQKNSKELITLKVQLELATEERKSLHDQTRSQCVENIKLKRQIEDLESKHRCHTDFQHEISEQLSRVKGSITQFSDAMQSLKNKQEELQKVEEVIRFCENLKVIAKQFESQKNKAEEQKQKVEEQLIIKTAELSKLRELMESSPLQETGFGTNEVLNYWKSAAKDLHSKLKFEKDGNLKLTTALKLSNENQATLREKVNKSTDKIKELENSLQLLNLKLNSENTDSEVQTETEVICLDQMKTEEKENSVIIDF